MVGDPGKLACQERKLKGSFRTAAKHFRCVFTAVLNPNAGRARNPRILQTSAHSAQKLRSKTLSGGVLQLIIWNGRFSLGETSVAT